MPPEIIRFEDFELDPSAFELRRAGQLIKLERIPLQLLFLLAENSDRLVTRDEILRTIWGKDVFVDADNSINTAVRKARHALRDDPENPRFLRTVSGKGYRFTAQIKARVEVPATEVASTEPASTEQQSADTRNARSRLVKRVVWTALALVALLSAALILHHRLNKPPKMASRKVTLVVLPFLNLSADSKEDYFADGMTEEMITQLGSLDPEHLGVIARTSSMQYKGAQKGAAQVARELGVDYLLEGSVRREEHRVRVTAQLIQASDQTHVWAADFDRDLQDVLKLQSELALAISNKIELTISAPTRARLADAPQINAAAHETYLRGLHSLDLRTKPGVENAITEFQRAIELDANNAPAHAALARSYSLAPVVGLMSPAESMPKAREAALRAIALDPSLAAAHSTLGFVKAHFDFDWPGAENEYLQALDLNPNDASAHLFYSNSYFSPLGHHPEALQEMHKAIALDPFSAPAQSFLGRTLLWARREDSAVAQFLKCNEMFPGFAINHERLSQLYASQQRFDEAIAEDTTARLVAGEDENSVRKKETAIRQALAAGGSRGYWMKLLEITRMPDNPPEAYSSPFGTAILFMRLGEKTKALESLEKAYEQRALALTELAIEPAFDPLRDDPRFQALLIRLHLKK